MADPKDKTGAPEGKTPPGTPVPTIPRLTPAVPEPVGLSPKAPAAPQARPLASPAPPQVPLVPRVAPLQPPPAVRPPSFTPPPVARPPGLTPPPLPRPPQLQPASPQPTNFTPAPSPRPPGLAPAVPQSRTGSFPAAPAVPPVAARPVTPQAAVAGPPSANPLLEERVELERRFALLDQLDYFEVMGLSSTATPADIKRAFHHESRTYHPDRFFQSNDLSLREQVNAVYKRVTEAYFVLRDDTRRRKYLSDITGPDRLQKLRFDESAEAEAKAAVKKEVAEQIGTHPKGRQFFQTGVADLEAGRLAAAERNIKLALTYEPTNPLYLAKLEEARAKSYEEYTRLGKGFRIE